MKIVKSLVSMEPRELCNWEVSVLWRKGLYEVWKEHVYTFQIGGSVALIIIIIFISLFLQQIVQDTAGC